ncbi:MAG: hypothetical protein Q4C08_01985, partial [Pseudomonadota bacterium]|nr:hypothetical protein [Pseudomonadota bacterium]
NGIAGVSYVNRMVNAAGNAAELAEGHAAAAGAHALSAAQSAEEAHKVLADKVSIDQGADNKNKAMVTDAEGNVYPGYITKGMIEKHSVSTSEIQGPDESVNKGADWVLMGSGKSLTYWGKICGPSLAEGAVTIDKTDGVVGAIPIGSADATTYGQFWIE